MFLKRFLLDHDHLWFDPNWKHIGSNSSTCNNRKMNGSTHGHGIPSEDRVLEEGDALNIDVHTEMS